MTREDGYSGMNCRHFRLVAGVVGAVALGGVGACPSFGANQPGFVISQVSPATPGKAVVAWVAETNGFNNLFFAVQGSTSLGGGFSNISPPISESSSLIYTDQVLSAGSSAFYRVSATPAFTSLSQAGAFAAYAATNVNGMTTVGYAGAVFDGRYVYFVPYQNGVSAHGRVLRYDTQGTFTNAASWSGYDASQTGSGGATGYTGGVFDGRYVYFSPTAAHGRVLRYDVQGGFTNSTSWALYDAGATDGYDATGFQGAAFDGRFVYLVPHFNNTGTHWNGIVVRYDTQGPFTNVASWHAYDAGATGGLNTKGYSSGIFDGRYVYFIPVFNGGPNGCVLRYDPQGPFTNAASWAAYDAGHTGGLPSTNFKGAVFDGRFLFFVPYLNSGDCIVLRYDVQGVFTNAASWSAYNATNTSGLMTDGYDGAVFDGRYVYFVPYQNSQSSTFHGRVLSYDTQAVFNNPASWRAFDAGATGGLHCLGYVGAVSDGRYVYFSPFRNNADNFQGNVLRFDSRLPRFIPPTVRGGSNL